MIETNGLTAEETLDALEEVKHIIDEYGNSSNVFAVKKHIDQVMKRLHTTFSTSEGYRKHETEEEFKKN